MGRHFCSFCFFIFFLIGTSSADNTLVLPDTNGASSNGSVISTPSPSSSPPPPPPPLSPPNLVRTKFSPFRPSIAVIVGVLTTMFSVTLLLLLYAKHCKRSDLIAVGYGGHSLNSRGGVGGGGVTPSSSNARKNSGIDRSVIESLPVFRFGSLMGQKDGLECAVCLTRFESSEVLRLLPKCKHAFHVECVDTWLDAHSTCPLCRYRVDPEDILLVEDYKILNQNHNHQLWLPEPPPPPPPEQAEGNDTVSDIENQRSTGGEWGTAKSDYRRVSGRHSSAGERGTGFLQVLVQKPGGEWGNIDRASFDRRSVDSCGMQKKKKNRESVAMGCFDRPRKDGLLLTEEKTVRSSSEERRVEHRIIVSPGCSGFHQRWSDVHPSDLLYLRSEMIISDSRRFSAASEGSSRASTVTRQQNNMLVALQRNKKGDLQQQEEEEEEGNGIGIGIGIRIDENRWSGSGSGSGSGRTVINSRSVSEITGLSRFSNRRLSDSNDTQHCHHHHHHHHPQLQQQRQARLLSRWLAFISHSRPPPTT